MLDHARPHLNEDDYRTRALLQFASEEAKHIHLFRKFAEEFKAGFVTNCETIGPPEEIGKAVLSHNPLGVALVILGIEWMTQTIQRQALRWTYLGSAMTHPQFLQTVGEISPEARTQIKEMSKAFAERSLR